MGSCYYKPSWGLAGGRRRRGQSVGTVKSKNRGGSGSSSAVRMVRCPAVGGGALRVVSVGGGEGDQVHPVEFVADVAPGVAGGVLGHADQQERKPAQLHVGADPVLTVVEDRA